MVCFVQASVPAPAVTFCPHSSSSGWRNATTVSAGQFISSLCDEARPEAVERCVRENTFAMNIKQSVMNSSLWSSSMATVYAGLCHSFNYPRPLSAKGYAADHSLLFYLDPSLNYRVLIHDPKFYHIVSNSLVFPRIFFNFESEKPLRSGHYQDCEITLTQHHLLDRPEQPCEEEHEEEDYDFLQCVKTSQARRVGCRPPWDMWSPPSIPLCQSMEQLQQHEQVDQSYLQSEQQLIVNQTGCNIPCKFKVCYLRYFPRKRSRLFWDSKGEFFCI